MSVLKKYFMFFLLLISSSCTTKSLVGYYAVKNDRIFNYLLLKKDSSFIYYESSTYTVEGEQSPFKKYGVGKYTVNRDTVTLNFDKKFRNVHEISIKPAFNDSSSRSKNKTDDIGNEYIPVVFKVYPNIYQNERSLKDFYNTRAETINVRIDQLQNYYTVVPGVNDTIEINKSYFPLYINLEFNPVSKGLGFYDERIFLNKAKATEISIYYFKGMNDGYGTEAFFRPKVFIYKKRKTAALTFELDKNEVYIWNPATEKYWRPVLIKEKIPKDFKALNNMAEYQ